MALLGSCNSLFKESGALKDQNTDIFFSQVLNGEILPLIMILMFCKCKSSAVVTKGVPEKLT